MGEEDEEQEDEEQEDEEQEDEEQEDEEQEDEGSHFCLGGTMCAPLSPTLIT